MTEHEREELLKLWAEVPETRPGKMRHSDYGWFDDLESQDGSRWIVLVTDDHAAAIARDAMVEYLHDQCWQHNSAKQPHHPDYKERYMLWHGGSIGHTGETRLLALISACRKIAGKDSA